MRISANGAAYWVRLMRRAFGPSDFYARFPWGAAPGWYNDAPLALVDRSPLPSSAQPVQRLFEPKPLQRFSPLTLQRRKKRCLILIAAAINYQMPDVSDISLLQDYNRHASEEAFAELVRRHINLVYSTALRHAVISAHAEEIAQAVFVILARKAGALRPDTVLEAWLYETTRLTSLSFLRGERRRQFREQEAYMQSTIEEHSDAATWSQLAPLLDDAMARLGKKDRDAVMLRFFKEKNLREVALALNVTEAAAQSRVHRALEKLRHYFSKRGVASTTAIIANEISANSIHAAPAGLAKVITGVAVAKGATASASTLTLIKGAMKIMAWTKAQTAITAGVIVLLAAAGTATVTVKHIQNSRIDGQWEVQNPTADLLATLPRLFKIVPTKFPNQRASTSVAVGASSLGIGVYLQSIVRMAYNCDGLYDQNKRLRMLLLTKIPTARYDYIANSPFQTMEEYRHDTNELASGNVEALQKVLKKEFGLVGRRETVVTNVLLLEVKYPDAAGLEPVDAPNQAPLTQKANEICFRDDGCRILASALENDFRMPVMDETGLTNKYYYDLKWTASRVPRQNQSNLKQALLDQLGLEVVSTNMPVQMLVVESLRGR
jgi:uncharacterized protein (TIGR03435 family)